MISKEVAESLSGLLFPRKLWTLANIETVRSIRWARQGTTVQIDSVLVEKECFMPHVFNVRSNQHVLRQMSYYNFQKIDRKSKIWEFQHDNFQAGREDLLHLVRRQPQGVPKKYLEDFERRYSPRIQRERKERGKYSKPDGNTSDEMEEDSSDEIINTEYPVPAIRKRLVTRANSGRIAGKRSFSSREPVSNPASEPTSPSPKRVRGNSRGRGMRRGNRRGRRRSRGRFHRSQRLTPLLPKPSEGFDEQNAYDDPTFNSALQPERRNASLSGGPENSYSKPSDVTFEGNDGRSQWEVNNFFPYGNSTFSEMPDEDNKESIRALIQSKERAMASRNINPLHLNGPSLNGFQPNQMSKWNPPEVYIHIDGKFAKYTASDSGFESPHPNFRENPQSSNGIEVVQGDPNSTKQYIDLDSFTPNGPYVPTTMINGNMIDSSMCNSSLGVSNSLNEGMQSSGNMPSAMELLEATQTANAVTTFSDPQPIPAVPEMTEACSNWVLLDHNYNTVKDENHNDLSEFNKLIMNASIEFNDSDDLSGSLLSSLMRENTASGSNSSNCEEYTVESPPDHKSGSKDTSVESAVPSSPSSENVEVVQKPELNSSRLEPVVDLNQPQSLGNGSTIYDNSTIYDPLTGKDPLGDILSLLPIPDDPYPVCGFGDMPHQNQSTAPDYCDIDVKPSFGEMTDLSNVIEFLNENVVKGKKYAWDIKDTSDIVIKNCCDDFHIWKFKKQLQSFQF